MFAWTPPITVPTTASGVPVLVSTAGHTTIVVSDVSGATAAAAQPVVREIGLPGERVVAARRFTMLRGLATSAGPRIVVAGMQQRGRRLRGAVLAGAPGARLTTVSALPGPPSKVIAPPAPPAGPGPPLGFFPADNALDPSLLAGVAVPDAIAGDARGDIAVLYRRWRGKQYINGLELWLRRGGTTTVTTLSPPGRGLGATALSLDGRGNALVGWRRDGAVYARTVTGTRVSRTWRLAAAAGAGPVRARLSAPGRGVIAWGSQTGSHDGPETPFGTRMALQRGRGFGTPVVLGAAPPDDGYGYGAGIALAPLPGARTAVAWSGGGTRPAVQTATIAAGELVRGAEAAAGRLEALATSADGRTAIVASTDRRSVTVRDADAMTFAPSADLGATSGLLASLTFDAASRPFVAWREFNRPIVVFAGLR